MSACPVHADAGRVVPCKFSLGSQSRCIYCGALPVAGDLFPEDAARAARVVELGPLFGEDREPEHDIPPICRECGSQYEESGDGWDGLCPTCADRAEEQAS